jgi:hypothetical protein
MKTVLVIDEANTANLVAAVVSEVFGHESFCADSLEGAREYFDKEFDVAIIGRVDRYKEIHSRVHADRKVIYTTDDYLIKKCGHEGIEAIKNTGHEENDLAGVLKE